MKRSDADDGTQNHIINDGIINVFNEVHTQCDIYYDSLMFNFEYDFLFCSNYNYFVSVMYSGIFSVIRNCFMDP